MKTILLAALVVALIAGCMPGGPKELHVTVTDKGFEPESVTVKRGTDAVLVITRESEATCATEAVFTETGRRYDLPLHQPVRVALPTDAANTLHYACGMDMYRGAVVIQR